MGRAFLLIYCLEVRYSNISIHHYFQYYGAKVILPIILGYLIKLLYDIQINTHSQLLKQLNFVNLAAVFRQLLSLRALTHREIEIPNATAAATCPVTQHFMLKVNTGAIQYYHGQRFQH